MSSKRAHEAEYIEVNDVLHESSNEISFLDETLKSDKQLQAVGRYNVHVTKVRKDVFTKTNLDESRDNKGQLI